MRSIVAASAANYAILEALGQFVGNMRSFAIVFSRRFSSEKSPTITVDSFFFFLFSSDYNLTLIGPLFLQSKLLKLLP